jgi:alpha galactosidase A-like protein/alpha galactosidase C-like protein/alpha-galactosidase-like protein/alpha-galactosidase-like CBM13-containing protein
MTRLTRLLAAALLALPVAAVAGPQAAQAEDNGVGRTPVLGWSSWSFVRRNPTAAGIEAQADAMKSSGLARAGFKYVNVDDFWYRCPGGQGPDVDQYGRWVIDSAKFPDGIKAVADHVHHDGLKFGIYVTPGISKQAVAQNTAIEGTSYHAADIATTDGRSNYNCGGMVGIDTTKPGAQAFIDSWAAQFAGWGVDYLKIDGVGSYDIPDVKAWSDALRKTGRPIHLELSNSLNIADAATWKQYSNGWRTGGDIECYCGPGGSSYPLTTWGSISSRFDQVAAWQPYGAPGGFNDYDSIEVGNGTNDGLTLDERKTQMSLWSLAASPLILGTDLTHLDPSDLALLKNRDVLAVDQDGIDAGRLANSGGKQVFTKTEKNGDVIVGLFNTTGNTTVVSTPMAQGRYLLTDLWTHKQTSSGGTIAASVPAHGVALYRVRHSPASLFAPPSTTVTLDGLSAVTAGKPATATASFTNNGFDPVQAARFTLVAPRGWTVKSTSASTYATVAPGKTVTASFAVTAPTPDSVLPTSTLTAKVTYRWHLVVPQTADARSDVVTGTAVQSPYRVFSSASDAPAVYAQKGDQLGVSGAGADLWTDNDDYTTIYQPGVVGTTATVQAQVLSRQGLTGYGKAGLMVRNDMTASGTGPEGVVLFASPSGGIQLEWDNNAGAHINAVTPPNGSISDRTPVRLKLVRDGSFYTGYYSTDGSTWNLVGQADVPGQAPTQDAGVFITSHTAGTPAQAVFDGFTATATGGGGGKLVPYEAEAPANVLSGGASAASCTSCSGGAKVGFVGAGATLIFTGVTAPAAGTYPVVVAYLDGSDTGREATVTVNGGAPQTVKFTPTGGFDTVGTATVPLVLSAGTNTIEFANPADYTPDFDRILVPGVTPTDALPS